MEKHIVQTSLSPVEVQVQLLVYESWVVGLGAPSAASKELRPSESEYGDLEGSGKKIEILRFLMNANFMIFTNKS